MNEGFNVTYGRSRLCDFCFMLSWRIEHAQFYLSHLMWTLKFSKWCQYKRKLLLTSFQRVTSHLRYALQDGHFSNLVPRLSLLPRCPRGAWSGTLFSVRGLGRLLLGSVTARKVAYFAINQILSVLWLKNFKSLQAFDCQSAIFDKWWIKSANIKIYTTKKLWEREIIIRKQ